MNEWSESIESILRFLRENKGLTLSDGKCLGGDEGLLRYQIVLDTETKVSLFLRRNYSISDMVDEIRTTLCLKEDATYAAFKQCILKGQELKSHLHRNYSCEILIP